MSPIGNDRELVARLLRGEAAALAVNEANRRVLLHRARSRLRAGLLHHRATG